MENLIKKFEFNDITIEFEIMEDGSIMANATQMAKAVNKRLDVFLKTDHVKAFIEELKLTPNGGSFEALEEDKIVKKRSGSRTYFNKLLAYKFASWVSPKFEVWVYKTVDLLINYWANLQNQALLEQIQAEKELEDWRNKLLVENPEFNQYLKAEKTIKKAKSKRRDAVMKQANELRLNLFGDNELTALNR
jgi:hypothetical protein